MRADTDLTAYFERIGHNGPVEPSLTVLHLLVRQHLAAIPFENLDMLGGRVPRLDLTWLMQKMVTRRRGGSCCEQNMLLRAALTTMGYEVEGMIARPRLGIPDAISTQRSHMLLLVVLEGQRFLVDVGFGALVPTSPVPMDDETPVTTTNGRFRVLAEGAYRLLQSWVEGDWRNVYRVEPDPAESADYIMSNFCVATWPGGQFSTNLFVSRLIEDERWSLLNARFSISRKGAEPERRVLTSRDEFAVLLQDKFGLALEEQDLDVILHTVKTAPGERGIKTYF